MYIYLVHIHLQFISITSLCTYYNTSLAFSIYMTGTSGELDSNQNEKYKHKYVFVLIIQFHYKLNL